jgi:hypothetical protein
MFVKIYKMSGFYSCMKLDYASYALVIVVGIFMAALVFLKLAWGIDLDSDWFWMLAGLGLAVEGVISFGKQRRFDRKYKIIER